MANKLLHNIFARRQFTYKIDMKQTAKYLLISPDILKASIIRKDKPLSVACQRYCQDHPDMLRPQRYLTIRKRIPAHAPRREEILAGFDYELCTNLEVTLAIYGATIGSIYIPKRRLEFTDSSFNTLFLVDSEEVGL